MPQLTEAFIRSQSSPSVYSRGQQLVFQAKISELHISPTTIQAKAEGSSGHYLVRISLGEEISGSCTCPYKGPGWCKHLVATALSSLGQGQTDPMLLDFERLVAAFETDDPQFEADFIRFQATINDHQPVPASIKSMVAHLFGRWDRAQQAGKTFDLDRWKHFMQTLTTDPVSKHFLEVRLMGFGLHWEN
ncbi:MAG: hypothetical protein AAF206_31475 [Bacteroidota bacterium]